MRTQKVLSILVLISLLVLPVSGSLAIRPALASDGQPPAEQAVDQVDQSGAGPGDVQPSQGAQVGGSVPPGPAVTGADPSRGVDGTQLVEVVIPASVPPAEGTLAAGFPYHPRPETTYFIEKSVNLVPGPKVLLLEADDDTITASPIRSLLLAFGDLSAVDMYDALAATPTLANLLPYDVVVTWSDNAYDNPVAVGNVLADYVDAGGKVINLMLSFGTHPYAMQGRFMDDGYTAMNGTNFDWGGSCLGSYNPYHPIMTGISDVCEEPRITDTVLTPGSSSVAQWEDGRLFVAAKNNRSVVTINGYVGIYYYWTGQMHEVVHNAILWLVDEGGCNTVLWNNGPLVTHIGGGYNSANTSAVQTSLGMSTYGFTDNMTYRMADDFTVTNPRGWQVDQFTFYEYQTGAYSYPPVSTITAVYYQVWNGPPYDPTSEIVFGDLVTNRLLGTGWINTYRVLDTSLLDATRPIMAVEAEAGVHLPPGTYWVDWAAAGSLVSGPYAPPVTILGQTTTGNALQYSSSWEPANDTGTVTQQDMPFIVQGCSQKGAWQQLPSNPLALMDSVLAVYDGKIWSVAGYGTPEVSYYTPSTGAWTVVPYSSPPFGINYPRSGCQIGTKVYMYGDSDSTTFINLWSYDLATNAWSTLSPSGTPPPVPGIWAPSWVADPSTSRCYMTGGATVPGSGTLNTVYVYNASTNAWLAPLANFTSVRDFHAAYIFTNPADAHKLLCVAGGIASGALSSTQCYDMNTASWHAENADLGALPQAWWGMGYTQTPSADSDKLWLVAGVDSAGYVSPRTWFYSIPNHTWVDSGPLQSGAVYRTSAVSLNRIVYHIGGSISGFSPSGLSDWYVGFPVHLPSIVR